MRNYSLFHGASIIKDDKDNNLDSVTIFIIPLPSDSIPNKILDTQCKIEADEWFDLLSHSLPHKIFSYLAVNFINHEIEDCGDSAELFLMEHPDFFKTYGIKHE